MRLIIEDDEGHKTVVPFQREEITIGRGEENTIRLPERNVSRRHCRLTRDATGTWVEDLHSYNGVRVNGERISARHAIAPGDVLQIGDYDVSLDADVRPETTPPGFGLEATQPSMQAVAAPAGPPPVNLVREVKPVPEGERPRVVMVAGPQPGREIVLEKTVVSVGRARECNVVIEDPSLARTHAQLVRDGGQWKVVEVSAVHAVRVNGEPCTEAPLQDGDVLSLGEVQLRWVAPGALFFWVPPPEPSRPEPTPARSEAPASKRLLGVLLAGVAALAAWFFWPAEKPVRPGPTPPPPPEVVAPPPAPAPAPPPSLPASTGLPGDGGLAAQAKEQLERGARLAEASQCKQALLFFERALDLDPGLAEAHKHLGACYAQLRDGDRAALHYRKLLELAPDHPSAPQIRRYLETYRQNTTGGPVRSE